ncbi:ectonucleoside triphosphate diphosphohydrolase 8-like [Mercenaria mercenaria]|uniref:ectonucleoside triphosphate diphosphohydrolase 8-like n=1 Tax=Mercenaria mercenaria TaxID=6596 RepID=UPI00234F908C|nr:ectonucleoside triphosphate diphosphohydrolase 8-like [Mercenaria mercenaria]XP_053407806.1 ectonucleoside triphosphate diphosphohydrolase 8-like [Mercenaria mercenaria]XP_053407807.1 ectonucleoside triphosphate diphosphohydrolase 8-like [Mercenaria mercenaria]XP_053407808.1 ectonucleoside triphosphate diphosphohydrolase 8-like [Mercenaria mercenaria]
MDDILVEIVCRVPTHESKTFSVATPERNTVAGVIRKVCKENGIPMKTSYALLDRRERVLQWSQTLLHCGVKHNDVLYLTNEDEDVQVHNGCSWNSWWFVAAISLLIGGVGITAITILYTKNGETQYQYGVVLDAGSSHTKLFVYKWDGEKLHETAEARQVHTCTVPDSGITSYISHPGNLSGPLSVCLEEAKQHVPYDNRQDTQIFLGATAGMRMLNETDPVTSNEILNKVQDTIKKFPFSFKTPSTQARIISGKEEGTFGWITANYISGKLGVVPKLSVYAEPSSPEATIGALDMGGASTQITFYSGKHEEILPQYKEDLELYGKNYSVYTHSYLCYGINEAVRRYQAQLVKNQGYNETNITNPCGPKGYITEIMSRDIFEAPCVYRYTNQFLQIHQLRDTFNATNYTFIGTGDEEECKSTVKMLYNFNATCPQEPCTVNGTYQPPVQGNFYAFSSFFYEMDFLNLTRKKASLKTFTTELSKLCNTSWEEVSHMPAGNNGSMLGWYCFEGHFIRTLLVDAYKFDNITWENINFVKKINNTDIGWTLGYMLNSSNVIPVVGPEHFITTTAFSSLTVLFAIFILLSVGFGCYARKHQQEKTLGLYERVPTYGAV